MRVYANHENVQKKAISRLRKIKTPLSMCGGIWSFRPNCYYIQDESSMILNVVNIQQLTSALEGGKWGGHVSIPDIVEFVFSQSGGVGCVKGTLITPQPQGTIVPQSQVVLDVKKGLEVYRRSTQHFSPVVANNST